MVDTYVYYKTKVVLLKDVIDELQDLITVYYKKEKIRKYKKEDLKKCSWMFDKVNYYANFHDEKSSTVYLEPNNKYLKTRVI